MITFTINEYHLSLKPPESTRWNHVVHGDLYVSFVICKRILPESEVRYSDRQPVFLPYIHAGIRTTYHSRPFIIGRIRGTAAGGYTSHSCHESIREGEGVGTPCFGPDGIRHSGHVRIGHDVVGQKLTPLALARLMDITPSSMLIPVPARYVSALLMTICPPDGEVTGSQRSVPVPTYPPVLPVQII